MRQLHKASTTDAPLRTSTTASAELPLTRPHTVTSFHPRGSTCAPTVPNPDIYLDPQRLAAGIRTERILASPQWHGGPDGRFRNADTPPGMPRPPLSVMASFMFRRARRTPPRPLPVARPHETWARPPGPDLRVTWLGHSTVVLEIDGHRVLTDPVFGERASPFRHIGPRRFHATPATLGELPPLDAVLLSHDHFDHLCAASIRELAAMRVPIITALGVGVHLLQLGVDPALVHELDWHESAEIRGLRFTAAPAQHFSGRTLRGRNRTLWASWVVATDRHRIFFSGDTGLTPAFTDTGRRYGPFDLIMLEVGAFHESWASVHLGPANALKVFDMLGGGTLLPVHWGTFNLALHDWDEPAETLVTLGAEGGKRIITPRPGQPVLPLELQGPDPWWRAFTDR